MPTIFEAVTEKLDIVKLVDREFAGELVRKMGYDWPVERVERVAHNAREHLKAGRSAPFAFARAIEIELTMYGDGSSAGPVGILSPSVRPSDPDPL